jgi:hypothetical protein
LICKETIILWKECSQLRNIDYALSFQEAEGCLEIWNMISVVQGEYLAQREYGSVPSFSRTQRLSTLSDNGGSSISSSTEDEVLSSVYKILPVDFCRSEGSLNQMKNRLESLHPSQRDYVLAQLLHEVSLYCS